MAHGHALRHARRAGSVNDVGQVPGRDAGFARRFQRRRARFSDRWNAHQFQFGNPKVEVCRRLVAREQHRRPRVLDHPS